jgi:hypothetical protein
MIKHWRRVHSCEWWPDFPCSSPCVLPLTNSPWSGAFLLVSQVQSICPLLASRAATHYLSIGVGWGHVKELHCPKQMPPTVLVSVCSGSARYLCLWFQNVRASEMRFSCGFGVIEPSPTASSSLRHCNLFLGVEFHCMCAQHFNSGVL